MSMFKKAEKINLPLRSAIDGPSGSGKTYTGLKLAASLCPPGKRVRLLDTERGSSLKYAHRFDFDHGQLTAPYTAARYIEAIKQGGSDPETGVLVIDSLSHAWSGEGGALEKADAEKAKTRNDFTAWRAVSADHAKLVEAILACPCHIIVTMRTKMEYVLEKDEKTGRTKPVKVGMKPIQREGMEYEFDVVMDMDLEHNGIISKTRCEDLDGKVYNKPGEEMADVLKRWLTDGSPAPVAPTEFTKASNEVSEKVDLVKEKLGFTEMSPSELICIRINECQTVDDLSAVIPVIKEKNLIKDAEVRAAYAVKEKELKQ
jgi:hypothetical protein